MLDLFTIFSKGGIVLWCFQGTCQSFTLPVNELIRSVILQVSVHRSSFESSCFEIAGGMPFFKQTRNFYIFQ